MRLATYDAGTGLRLFNYNQNPQKLDEVFSYKTAQGTKYYPSTDMLGSVYAVSDSTGTSQATYSYDVYGAQTVVSGNVSYPFGFTGCELDRDLGTYKCGVRVYDPATGSWIQPDRTQVVSMKESPNLYLYGLDNPTRYSDPTGAEVLTSDFWYVFYGVPADVQVSLQETDLYYQNWLAKKQTEVVASPYQSLLWWAGRPNQTCGDLGWELADELAGVIAQQSLPYISAKAIFAPSEIGFLPDTGVRIIATYTQDGATLQYPVRIYTPYLDLFFPSLSQLMSLLSSND